MIFGKSNKRRFQNVKILLKNSQNRENFQKLLKLSGKYDKITIRFLDLNGGFDETR